MELGFRLQGLYTRQAQTPSLQMLESSSLHHNHRKFNTFVLLQLPDSNQTFSTFPWGVAYGYHVPDDILCGILAAEIFVQKAPSSIACLDEGYIFILELPIPH